MNDKYKQYLRSEEWANIKVDLITLRGNRCQRCGKKKALSKLQVHHKTYKNIFLENPEDLELVCAPCHMAEHNLLKPKKAKVKKRPQKKLNIWQIVNAAKNSKNPNAKKWGKMYSKQSKKLY